MFKTPNDFAGYWIKNIKNRKGHEGEKCSQGTLYFKGKRIGTFAQDINNGPMDWQIEDANQQNAFISHVRSLPQRFISPGGMGLVIDMTPELFISELLGAVECLNKFSKNCKKQTLYTVHDEPDDIYILKAEYLGNEDAINDILDKKYGSAGYTVINEEVAKAQAVIARN